MFETFFGKQKHQSLALKKDTGLMENKNNPMLKKTKNLVTPYKDDPLEIEKKTEQKTEKKEKDDSAISLSGTVIAINRRFDPLPVVGEPLVKKINLDGRLGQVEENKYNIRDFCKPFGGRNKVRSLMLVDNEGVVKKHYKSKLAFQKDTGKRVTKTFNNIGDQVSVSIDGEKHQVIAITLQDYNDNYK
jgi:hypothetical protein